MAQTWDENKALKAAFPHRPGVLKAITLARLRRMDAVEQHRDVWSEPVDRTAAWSRP